MTFSANGRYLLAQARFAYKHDLLVQDNVAKTKTAMIFDLKEGLMTEITLSNTLPLSFDMDDGHFRILRVTNRGAVEMTSFLLPDLSSFERHILTFIPIGLCCVTCGRLMETDSRISLVQHYGKTSIMLGHTPFGIGKAMTNSEVCEPWILRLNSPKIPVEVNQIADNLFRGKRVKHFPKVLEDNLETIPVDIFDHQKWKRGEKATATTEVCLTHVMPIITNFFDLNGKWIHAEFVEATVRQIHDGLTDALVFGASEAFTELFSKMTSEFLAADSEMPFENWSELREAWDSMEENDMGLKAIFAKFFEPGKCGIGCRTPFFIHTFYYPEAGKSDCLWSSAFDVGWIEEDIEWFYERFFRDDFEHARQWYGFPAYETLHPPHPFDEEEVKELEGASQQQMNDMFIRKWRKLTAKRKSSRSKKNEDGDDDDLFMEQDMLDALNDLMPGMGRAMRVRVQALLSSILVNGIEDE